MIKSISKSFQDGNPFALSMPFERSSSPSMFNRIQNVNDAPESLSLSLGYIRIPTIHQQHHPILIGAIPCFVQVSVVKHDRFTFAPDMLAMIDEIVNRPGNRGGQLV